MGAALFAQVMGNDGMLKGRTRVLVTNALQYLPNADRVVVLEAGKVAESGTYDELMAKGLDFAALMEAHGISEEDEDLEGDLDAADTAEAAAKEKAAAAAEAVSEAAHDFKADHDHGAGDVSDTMKFMDGRRKSVDGRRPAGKSIDGGRKSTDGRKSIGDGRKSISSGRRSIGGGGRKSADGAKDVDGPKELDDGKTKPSLLSATGGEEERSVGNVDSKVYMALFRATGSLVGQCSLTLSNPS